MRRRGQREQVGCVLLTSLPGWRRKTEQSAKFDRKQQHSARENEPEIGVRCLLSGSKPFTSFSTCAPTSRATRATASTTASWRRVSSPFARLGTAQPVPRVVTQRHGQSRVRVRAQRAVLGQCSHRTLGEWPQGEAQPRCNRALYVRKTHMRVLRPNRFPVPRTLRRHGLVVRPHKLVPTPRVLLHALDGGLNEV